jgi:hypothetical protein
LEGCVLLRGVLPPDGTICCLLLHPLVRRQLLYCLSVGFPKRLVWRVVWWPYQPVTAGCDHAPCQLWQHTVVCCACKVVVVGWWLVEEGVLGPWLMLTVVCTSALVVCKVDVIASDLPGFLVSTPAALRQYGCVGVGECVLHPQTCPCCFCSRRSAHTGPGVAADPLWCQIPCGGVWAVCVCVCVCVCGRSWGSLYALVMHPHL